MLISEVFLPMSKEVFMKLFQHVGLRLLFALLVPISVAFTQCFSESLQCATNYAQGLSHVVLGGAVGAAVFKTGWDTLDTQALKNQTVFEVMLTGSILSMMYYTISAVCDLVVNEILHNDKKMLKTAVQGALAQIVFWNIALMSYKVLEDNDKVLVDKVTESRSINKAYIICAAAVLGFTWPIFKVVVQAA
jgi:hypothetical protein